MPTPLKMTILITWHPATCWSSCNMLSSTGYRLVVIIVEHADINTLGAGLESGEDHRMSHGEGKTLMPKLLLLRGLS